MKFILKTKSFVERNFLIRDLEICFENKIEISLKKLDNEFYEFEFKDNDLEFILFGIIYYSRLFSKVYLKIEEKKLNEKFYFFQKPNTNFLIKFENNVDEDFLKKNKNLKVDLKNYEFIFLYEKFFDKDFLMLDLTNTNLSFREYKVNKIPYLSINSILVNYFFYECGIDKENTIKLLDFNSNLGDIIIEANSFLQKEKFNFKYNYPFLKIFNIEIKFLEETKKKSKDLIVGNVFDFQTFKKLKENISYSKQKIKICKFSLDFFDIKFKKNQFDYNISFLRKNKNKEMKSFFDEVFYQLDFAIKKKICLICNFEFDFLTYIKKFKFKFYHKQIENNDEKYFIYFFEK